MLLFYVNKLQARDFPIYRLQLDSQQIGNLTIIHGCNLLV